MRTENPHDIDHAAIEDHAQRTVERTALRKVRKALDRIEEAEARQRRLLRNTLIGCAVLFAVGALVFWALFFAGR